MAKVAKGEFSKSRPVLKPEHLNGASHVMGTIEEAERIVIEDQPKIVLRFEEFPEYNYFPNATSIGRLIDGAGDETDDWVSVTIPLEVVQTTNPKTHKPTKALWISDPAEWTALKKQFRQHSARPVAKKKARR